MESNSSSSSSPLNGDCVYEHACVCVCMCVCVCVGGWVWVYVCVEGERGGEH